jgi:hypothetical protein
MSRYPLAFLLSSNLVRSYCQRDPSGCLSRFRIRIGLSGSQGIDTPNSVQGLAVKPDERVLSEGSIN